MLTALLALGLWPLLVIGIASVILIAFLENDEESKATITVLLGTGIVLLLTSTNPLPWLAANSLKILLGVLAYIAIGVLYSFPKWYFFLLKQRDRLRDRLAGASAEAQSIILAEYKVPTAREHKSRILGWMTYWPWSAAWTLLNDPIRRAYRAIYTRLSGLYERIGGSVFHETKIGIAEAKELREARAAAKSAR